MTALRDYQIAALEQLRIEMRAGHRRVVLVAPTGAGKTILIAEIARRHHERGGRVLVVAHRRELVGQTIAKLRAAGVVRIGIIAAGQDFDHAAPVLVASVQTLLARDALPEGVSLLILDEGHHYVADEWRKIAAHYSAGYVVGFTATPMRGDGSPLGDVFDALVVVTQTADLIAAGYLVPCEVVTPERATRDVSEPPLDAWRKYTREGARPSVVFCESVEAACKLALDIGPGAACVTGETLASVRADAIARFDAGELHTLTNVFVLTEGWDSPRVEVAILARGCEHAGTFMQIVGRVLRPSPGKSTALLVDLRGSVHAHGLPDERKVFSLGGRAIVGVPPTKDCPACGSDVPLGSRTCRECGHVFEVHARAVDVAPMVRLTKDLRERLYFIRMLEIAGERGLKPGWVVFRFAEKFGRKPWALWRELVSGSKRSA